MKTNGVILAFCLLVNPEYWSSRVLASI